MWKITLVLVFQRILLILVALFAINQSLRSTDTKSLLHPSSALWSRFIQKISHEQNCAKIQLVPGPIRS